MVVVIISLVYVCTVLLLSAFFGRREHGIGTFFIFGIGAFIYYIAIPLEITLHRMGFAFMGDNIAVPEAELAIIAILGLMSLIAFAAGYGVSGMRFRSSAAESFGVSSPFNRVLKQERRGSGKAPVMLVLLGVVGIALFYPSLLVEIGSYQGRYVTMYSHGRFAFLMKLVTVGTGVYAVYLSLVKAKYWPLFIGGLILVSVGFYSSEKNPLLILFMSGLAIIAARVGKIRMRHRVAGLIVVLFLSSLFPIWFSGYRAGHNVSFTEAYSSGLFVRSDPSGPFISLVQAVSEPPEPRFGATYPWAVVNIVPSFVWPDKPLTLAEEFARVEIANWIPGQGKGYSLLAEGILNFGIAGAPLHYFLLGLVWGLFWRCVRIVLRRDHALYEALYLVVGFYTLILMHRGDSAVIVNQLLHVPLLIIVFHLVFDRVRLVLPDRTRSNSSWVVE